MLQLTEIFCKAEYLIKLYHKGTFPLAANADKSQ